MNTKFDLLDFGVIDNNQVSIDELLYTSYIRGRKDVIEEIQSEFKKNLQSAAQSSVLLKLTLDQDDVTIKDMFLKVIDYNTFKCLIIVERSNYFDRDKRRKIYRESKNINSTNNSIELDILVTPFSENIEITNIISDGFKFRHNAK